MISSSDFAKWADQQTTAACARYDRLKFAIVQGEVHPVVNGADDMITRSICKDQRVRDLYAETRIYVGEVYFLFRVTQLVSIFVLARSQIARFAVRRNVVRSQIVVLQDSLTETTWIAEVCGADQVGRALRRHGGQRSHHRYRRCTCADFLTLISVGFISRR